MIEGTKLVLIRVSNGTGKYNFSGQRDRSSFIVPGPWDNGTSSKCWPGWGFDIMPWDRPGRDIDSLSHPVPGQDLGQKGKKSTKIKSDEKIFF
jgi:hypothetical protein